MKRLAHTGVRGQAVVIGIGLLMLLTLALLAGTAMAAGHHHGHATPRRAHADYLDSDSSQSQCDVPIAERVGNWICPAK